MASSGDYAIIWLLAIMSVLSFTGSLLIIIAAVINKKLRSFTHILIINQAAADMLLSTISLPLRILRMATTSSLLNSTAISSTNYCIFTTFTTIILFGASVFSLFLLTLDRFLGIRFPMRYRIQVKTSHLVLSIIIAWLIPVAIGMLPLFVTQLQSEKSNLTDSACVYGHVISLSYMLFVNVATLLLPLLVMICMYVSIIQKVHLSWTAVRRSVSKQKDYARRASVVNPALFRKKELRLARGIFCILFIHVLCLTPIVIIDWIQTFSGVQLPLIVIQICLFLTYSNAVVDPLIYATFSKEYKNTFWSFMTGRCCRYGRRGSTSSASYVTYNNNLAKIFNETARTVEILTPGMMQEDHIQEINSEIPDVMPIPDNSM